MTTLRFYLFPLRFERRSTFDRFFFLNCRSCIVYWWMELCEAWVCVRVIDCMPYNRKCIRQSIGSEVVILNSYLMPSISNQRTNTLRKNKLRIIYFKHIASEMVDSIWEYWIEYAWDLICGIGGCILIFISCRFVSRQFCIAALFYCFTPRKPSGSHHTHLRLSRPW